MSKSATNGKKIQWKEINMEEMEVLDVTIDEEHPMEETEKHERGEE